MGDLSPCVVYKQESTKHTFAIENLVEALTLSEAHPLASMAEPKTKYDRQLRIWGDQGQAALEKASICLLNCGPTGSGDIEKSCSWRSGKHNSHRWIQMDESSVGQSKAKCVCAFLQELNDALVEASLLRLDRICRQANIMLICARSYGLTGLVRISLKEHTVVESKPDHFLDDLRLNNPWPELKRFAESIDLNTTDPVVHKHIPYVVILVKIADDWAQAHGGRFPSSREEKGAFKELIKSKMIALDEDNYKEAVEASFKISAPQGITLQLLFLNAHELKQLVAIRRMYFTIHISGSSLHQIINDHSVEVDSTSSDFWVMVGALKSQLSEFISCDDVLDYCFSAIGELLYDLCQLSCRCYVNLQKIYQAKAEADFLAVEQQYRPIEEEFNSPSLPEMQKYLNDEDCRWLPIAIGFYILLRAVDRFAANYNRFPGIFDGELDEDIPSLKATAQAILNDLGCNGSTLMEDLTNDMCRYGGAELHAVAAFVGGVASQEAIKLITKQFVPMTGTFIFNGIDQKSQLLIL
ncbi:hypothetical protein Scep_012941 [Stephania cephalantha]|uniref:NEDD8-activating enzyme E1 regulatory subunit n=1 Tax=Stephania cephalantha TaxID=152367 RepID=A0AAP0JHW2_9MAGN